MRFLHTIVLAGACLGAALSNASAGPARFWISESKTNPGAPAAPTIEAAIGRQRTLYIWAQPATDTNEAFRELENFSIDVVTLLGPSVTSDPPDVEPYPFIDFIDGTFKVENPTVISGQKRFQYTTDSFRDEEQGGPVTSDFTAESIMEFDLPDAIRGLQGVSPFTTPSTVGIGHTNDPYKVGSGSSAAWRVAEFSFQALQSSGTNHLYLQIGWAGMRHEADGTGTPLLATQVVFGDDTTPVYTAGPSLDHRETTLLNDTFDLEINAVPFTPGDYNGNGSVGPEDYLSWQTSFGQSVAAPGDGADGNSDGVVGAADYVFWRKLPGSGGSGSSANDSHTRTDATVVPEPTSAALASILLNLMLLGLRAPYLLRRK